MSKHTPGPWHTEDGIHIDRIVSDGHRYTIAECFDPGQLVEDGGWDEDPDARTSNARLMAAAPEMYDALRTLVILAYGANRANMDERVKAAMAKARLVISKAGACNE